MVTHLAALCLAGADLCAPLLLSLTALAAPVARSSTPMAGLVRVPTTPHPIPEMVVIVRRILSKATES